MYSNELIHFYAHPNALLYNFNDYRKKENFHALNLHEWYQSALRRVFRGSSIDSKITFIRFNKMCVCTMETIANRLIISKKAEKGMIMMMMTMLRKEEEGEKEVEEEIEKW